MRVFVDARSIDIWPYGVGRYARELAAHLPALRPDWDWIVLRHGAARQERQANAVHLWRPLPFGSYGEEQKGLAGILDETEPDLVHTLWFPVPEHGRAVKVLTIHDTIPLLGYPEFASEAAAQQNTWRRRSVALSDLIVTPSFSTMRSVARHHSFPASRIAVTPEGVSRPFLETTPESRQRARERYGLPASYVFCSAHQKSVSYKNVRVVEDAWRALRSAGAAMPMLVSAGSVEPGRDETWIRLPMLDDRDLASVLAGAALMVYPSKAEGFGLPVLEAMACGVPVLCSNAMSLPEVGGEAVAYFDPDDVDELAATVKVLMDAGELRGILSRSGRERARSFPWKRTAEWTLRAYDKALADPRVDKPRNVFTAGPAAGSSMDRLRERGKALKAENRWAEARPVFEDMLAMARATDAADHQRSALYHLGECCLRTGAYSEAQSYLRECMVVCPTHQAAPLLLQQLHRTQDVPFAPPRSEEPEGHPMMRNPGAVHELH